MGQIYMGHDYIGPDNIGHTYIERGRLWLRLQGAWFLNEPALLCFIRALAQFSDERSVACIVMHAHKPVIIALALQQAADLRPAACSTSTAMPC